MIKDISILALIVAITISFGSYFIIKKDFENVKLIKNIKNDYNVDLQYEIEDIIYSDKYVLIKALVTEINSKNDYINRSILLKGENGDIISIKTEYQEREDLSWKNTEKINYTKSGLIGRINNNKFIKGQKYQVGFRVISQDEKEKIVFTNEIIELS